MIQKLNISLLQRHIGAGGEQVITLMRDYIIPFAPFIGLEILINGELIHDYNVLTISSIRYCPYSDRIACIVDDQDYINKAGFDASINDLKKNGWEEVSFD